jgi:membrane-bound serine protease (ClpP class)
MEILTLIVLVLIGFALIAVEVYVVPGLNVVGILGILVLIFAIGYAFSSAGMWGGLSTLGGTAVLGGGILYAMWRSGAWEEFVLATSMIPGKELPESSQDNRARYLGKVGAALTPLRPSGVAEIDGERVEVQTEGGFIAANSQIRVVAIDRRHIFVRLDTESVG